MIKNKSILITGGYGFLGSNIYQALKKKNKVVRFGSFKKKKIINYLNLKRLDFFFDIIIHCAGGSSVSKSFINPTQDYKKTVISTNAVIRYLKSQKNKTKLIYISSPAVYGNSIDKKILKPISPYGKNKLKSEKLLIQFSKFNDCEITIIRFFSLYGEGLNKQLIWDTLKKIKKKNYTFCGTGDEKRSWMYVKDAVKIIKLSIVKSKKKIRIIDAPGNITLKNKALINLIYKLSKILEKPRFNGVLRKGDPVNLSSNTIDLRRMGFKKYTTLKNGLKNYIKWFKKR